MEGMTRFLNRVYRFGMEVIKNRGQKTEDRKTDSDSLSNPTFRDPSSVISRPSSDLYRFLQKLIKVVGEDLENLKFNTAIAKMMEGLNMAAASYQHPANSLLKFLETYILLLAPLAPHLSEELFQELRNSRSAFVSKKSDYGKARDFVSVHDQPWPEYDPKALTADEVTIVVQINGKFRDSIIVGVRSSRPQIISLARKSPKIQKYLNGKKITNIIYVPLKLLNFVVE